MEKVTAEQVQKTVQERGINLWKLRECSICQTPLTYAFNGGEPTYNSNCGCTSYSSKPALRSWESVAEIFNRQTPEIRLRMWDAFLASGTEL